MPLVRMTEKRLAANRANAQKSTGPRTPEGKARTAANACKHHLYARTYTVPENWHESMLAEALDGTAELAADPSLRELVARFIYFQLWANELDILTGTYISDAIAACDNDVRRGIHAWWVKTPLARAFSKRRRHIHLRILRASRDITRYQRIVGRIARLPEIPSTAPSTFAAGAGATSNSHSAEPTRNFLITNRVFDAPGETVPACNTSPAPSSACRTLASKTQYFICDTIPLRRVPHLISGAQLSTLERAK